MEVSQRSHWYTSRAVERRAIIVLQKYERLQICIVMLLYINKTQSDGYLLVFSSIQNRTWYRKASAYTKVYIYILNKEITKQQIDKQTVNEQTLENGESIFI